MNILHALFVVPKFCLRFCVFDFDEIAVLNLKVSDVSEILSEHFSYQVRLIEPAYPFPPAMERYGNDNAVFKYQFPTLDCAARILLNNIAQRREGVFRAAVLECVNERADDTVAV